MTILPVFSGKECKKLHLAFLCKKSTNQGQSLLCKKYFCVSIWFSIIFCVIFLFSLFCLSLVIPIRLHFELNLSEFCLHCEEKEKRPKRLFPSALAQAILLLSVIPVGCTKFFLQRFMGASSIMIKKAIRYLTDVSGHP